MDRRYRMELQLVKVPVVWKAKVPEKKLRPVTRKMPVQRRIIRNARKAAYEFFAAIFEGMPALFTPPMFQKMPEPGEGENIEWRRYSPLPRMEDIHGPAADADN